MNKIEHQIYAIFHQMDAVWRAAIGSRRRREWCRENGCGGNRDWIYELSADDVIAKKIPSRVAGRVAVAKLFCKFAQLANFDCYVVCTAEYDDWISAHAGNDCVIKGYPLIAVEIDGKLRAFDPSRNKLLFFDYDVSVWRYIKFPGPWAPRPITAIVSRDKFLTIDTYQKMHNLYVSGDIENSEFVLNPADFVIEYPQHKVRRKKHNKRKK